MVRWENASLTGFARVDSMESNAWTMVSARRSSILLLLGPGRESAGSTIA